ncbi:hypothetical protein [Ectothiorhodospira lacustris]|uniref:hypothetical protein n=1 Tax=Ectothiorhodospira lacustris TaxID=2899127 RepID=UPI001EE8676D|nr:hypothetical protein [Ectothiorhodospira lacustris]MCG5509621.1 hypothetical protein [Ectothiorhodospira lacustris]MCG5521584.1 hypothetical protein [Ectothiorhodospira lacustris]
MTDAGRALARIESLARRIESFTGAALEGVPGEHDAELVAASTDAAREIRAILEGMEG